MHSFKMLLAAAMVSCVLSTATACAPFLSVLPSVIKLVTDATLVLDTIHDYVDTYQDLSESAKGDIHAALEKARHAFEAVKQAAKGASEMSDGRLTEALASARAAYDQVLALMSKHGVKHHATDSRLFGALEGQGLVVPTFDRLKADSL